MVRARQVQEILSTRNLTLRSISRKSSEIFGNASEFHIPHTLFSGQSRKDKNPAVCQLVALSRITEYRLADWLMVFGFDLDAIFGLQLAISRGRTVLLDSTVYNPYAWVPWFADRAQSRAIPAIAPLSQLLSATPAQRTAELLALNQRKFIYAVVGEQDFHALPHFVPGSVVRADPLHPEDLWAAAASGESFFLVEHERGWTCSRLTALGNDRVLLHCAQRPCDERELRINRDGRVLGIIDAELRPMVPRAPGVFKMKSTFPQARRAGVLHHEANLKELLRTSRARAGLTFRDASTASRWIAEQLGDRSYFAAASTLSDYEILSRPPRQIQKMITLCLLYSIRWEQFLRACHLPDPGDGEPMPEELLGRGANGKSRQLQPAPWEPRPQISGGFLGSLLEQWKEIPLFLRFSLDQFAGRKRLSLSDVFWVAGEKYPRHRLLVNASLVVINRQAKKVAQKPGSKAERPRALHLLLAREGNYLCGHCLLDRGLLVLEGYPRGGVSDQSFRNGIDAEVVGRVTAILRKLP